MAKSAGVENAPSWTDQKLGSATISTNTGGTYEAKAPKAPVHDPEKDAPKADDKPVKGKGRRGKADAEKDQQEEVRDQVKLGSNPHKISIATAPLANDTATVTQWNTQGHPHGFLRGTF